MENYKIYISKEGQICAILLPEEPKLNAWRDDIDSIMQEALSKAKQEAVPFKDVADTVRQAISKLLDLEDFVMWLNSHKDQIFDLPEGYSVEVGLKVSKEDILDSNNSAPQYAILKKTSPPLPVNTEDEHYDVKEYERVKEFMKGKEDEKGVDQKEEKNSGYKEDLRMKWEDYLNIRRDFQWESIFNFFYSEIEKRDKELSSLRKAMEAADEISDLVKQADASPLTGCTISELCDKIREYTSLRSQQTTIS